MLHVRAFLSKIATLYSRQDSMDAVYVFLIEWDIPIYFLGTIGLLLSAIQFVRAQSILRRAMFSLEMETGREIRTNALLVLLVCIGVMGAVGYVNLQIAPTLPASLLEPPTPTPDIFSAPLSSPTPLGGVSEPNGTVRPRVTPDLVATATLPADVLEVLDAQDSPAVSTIAPDRASGAFIPEGGGCNPAVNISLPRPDSTVFGTIEFVGTASDDNFGAYLLELNGAGTGGDWIDILGGRVFDRVENDVLGAINLSTLQNGPYEARLTLFDLSGDTSGQCNILFQVNNE